MLNFLRDLFDPAVFGGHRRSSDWRRVRNEHIKKFPYCAVTGDTRKLEVHHIIPFHIDPTLELEPSNLITLRRDMHLLFGHYMNWSSYNAAVGADAEDWRYFIENRPE